MSVRSLFSSNMPRLAISYGCLFMALMALACLHADEAKVSFSKEIRPLFRRSCTGCHQPMKAKGGLDLTTHTAALKTGKHAPDIRPGDAKASRLIKDISGDEPAMPEEGDPLTSSEVALVTRWIEQGAIDDTPVGGFVHRLTEPPVYHSLPAVTALAWSPDDRSVAVGCHDGTVAVAKPPAL